MKVKFRPDDFVVEEILKDGVLRENGRFLVYFVHKEMIDTLSVLYELARELKVPRGTIFSCGLKDKYSVSKQYVAVDRKFLKSDPPKKVYGERWEGELCGYSENPLSPKSILRNIFRITLRDIHPDEVKDYENNIKVVSSLGFPNYFDEQRFGSARHFADEKMNSSELIDFIGKRVLLGDWEGALKIHFQALSDSDRSRVKKFKKIMREKWGRWAECLVEAQEKNDIEVLRYLIRKPEDFKGAFFRIDTRLARLYLEVYQDYIFNSVLSEIVKTTFDYHYVFPYFVGNFVFPYSPKPEHVSLLRNLKIPLPCKGAIVPREIKDIYFEVLRKENVSLDMFDTGDKKINFVMSVRAAWERPDEVSWKIKEDEFHEGRYKIELSFSLRPGVFATIFIKNITPLNPKSDTEKKPLPYIYDRNGKEIKEDKTYAKEPKKVIIISRSTS